MIRACASVMDMEVAKQSQKADFRSNLSSKLDDGLFISVRDKQIAVFNNWMSSPKLFSWTNSVTDFPSWLNNKRRCIDLLALLATLLKMFRIK